MTQHASEWMEIVHTPGIKGTIILQADSLDLVDTMIDSVAARRILPLLRNAIRGKTASSCRLSWRDVDGTRASLEILASETDPWPTLRIHGRHAFKPDGQALNAFIAELQVIARGNRQ